MKTSTWHFDGTGPNIPDRQAQLVRALLVALGLILSVVGWLRWAL